MDLTYEETMRRIEEYERTDPRPQKYVHCRENEFPRQVHIYKGENQLIVVPLVNAIGWYLIEVAWHRVLSDVQNAKQIGETVLEAFEHINVSPVDARTVKERKEDSFINCSTSCKSYKSFNRKYLLCGVLLYEDGRYAVSQTRRCDDNRGYGGRNESLIRLAPDTTTEEIGKSVLECFTYMEDFYKSLKKTKPSIPLTQFETLSEMKISFEAPQDDKYIDEQDYGAAEIYQGYSYTNEDADESVADMYFGIAAELDCDISPENIRKAFENQYGNIFDFKHEHIEHAVFEFRAEITNAKIHHVLYLKKIDDSELLSCELILKVKPAGKRLYSKITKDFEKMVDSCRIE